MIAASRNALAALLDALQARRPLVLDGAMGTMLPERHNTSLLCLTRPEVVSAVHGAYLDAGADIIRTNSFQANAIAQAGLGSIADVYSLNLRAAQLARDAVDAASRRVPGRQRLVAGAIGPIRSANPDAIRAAYRGQIRGLLDGGVELLLLETIVDASSVRQAIAAVEDEFAARDSTPPLMVSASLTREGRLLSGESVEQFAGLVRGASPFSVGLNCSFGVSHMRPFLERLSRAVRTWERPSQGLCSVSCHPNAGLPTASGEYSEGPADMARALADIVTAGVADIVGGCCGTNPEHTRATAAALEEVAKTRGGRGRR